MTSVRRFVRGWQTVVDGARMLRTHPQLVKQAIWPIVIGLAISLVTLGFFLTIAIGSILALHDWFQAGDSGWSRWLWSVTEVFVGIVVLAFSFGLAAATWLLLYAFFLSAALGKVAEETEKLLGASPDDFQSLRFSQEVGGTFLHLGLIVGVSAFALLLNALPIIGALLALLITTYVTWLMLGLEFLSHSLSLRGQTQWQQIRFARRHWAETMGLGSAVLVGQMIPLVGTLLHLCCTVGGVILYRELAQSPRSQRDTVS